MKTSAETHHQSQGPFGFQFLQGSEDVILHEVRLRAADLHRLHLSTRNEMSEGKNHEKWYNIIDLIQFNIN
jgi:hypothetical protein